MEIRNNARRAKEITNIFYILLFLSFAQLISNFLQYNLLSQEIYSQEEAQTNDLRQSGIMIIHLVVFIIAAIYYVRWFRRAYYNLRAAGFRTEHEDNWAVWSWVVPILNYFRPYSMMKEIWIHTQDKANYDFIKPTTLMGTWWGFWVLYNITSNIISRLPEQTVGEIQNTTVAWMGNNILEIAALILAILVVKEISKFEEDLFNALHETSLEDHLIEREII